MKAIGLLLLATLLLAVTRMNRTLAQLLTVLAFLAAESQAQLRITSVQALSTNAVKIAWPSGTNCWYRLEVCTNLSAPFWETVYPSMLATAPTNHYTNAVSGAGPMFWRVVGATSHAYFKEIGTGGNDMLWSLGTTNSDWMALFGFAGNDLLYSEGNRGDDWIEQYGGDGNDYLDAVGGSGAETSFQDGGPGADTLFASHTTGPGMTHVYQHGGDGNDLLEVHGSLGEETVWMYGEAGDDVLSYECWVVTPAITERVVMLGGDGDDEVMCSDLGGGSLLVDADGGAGTNTLHIQSDVGIGSLDPYIASTNAVRLVDRVHGDVLVYGLGRPTTVTVFMVNFAHVSYTNSGDGISFQWSPPPP